MLIWQYNLRTGELERVSSNVARVRGIYRDIDDHDHFIDETDDAPENFSVGAAQDDP